MIRIPIILRREIKAIAKKDGYSFDLAVSTLLKIALRLKKRRKKNLTELYKEWTIDESGNS